jgi:hypothetical protein
MSEEAAVARLMALMEEVEAGDALDFGEVPVEEADARRLVAAAMLEMQEDLVRGGVKRDLRELVLLATAGHLVLENFLMHYQRLKLQHGTAELSLEDLMARLRRGRR